MAKRRANEDSECRQERLRKQRRYAQQQRAAQKKCTEEQPTQSKNEAVNRQFLTTTTEKKDLMRISNIKSLWKI